MATATIRHNSRIEKRVARYKPKPVVAARAMNSDTECRAKVDHTTLAPSHANKPMSIHIRGSRRLRSVTERNHNKQPGSCTKTNVAKYA